MRITTTIKADINFPTGRTKRITIHTEHLEAKGYNNATKDESIFLLEQFREVNERTAISGQITIIEDL